MSAEEIEEIEFGEVEGLEETFAPTTLKCDGTGSGDCGVFVL